MKNKIHTLPELESGGSICHCLMFYDFNSSFSASWIEVVENLFDRFNKKPSYTAGTISNERSQGSYKRLKSKIKTRLSNEPNDVDLRIDSEVTDEQCRFFSSDMRITFGTAKSGIRVGMVSVKSNGEINLMEFVDEVRGLIFTLTGTCYAHAMDFPAVYGPDYYLVSVGAVPRGHSSTDNKDYRERITRWRDNIWQQGCRPNDGYIREVFPINFLTDNQLSAKQGGVSLYDEVKSWGALSKLSSSGDMYVWTVPDSQLTDARHEFELSDFVLSSKTVT